MVPKDLIDSLVSYFESESSDSKYILNLTLQFQQISNSTLSFVETIDSISDMKIRGTPDIDCRNKNLFLNKCLVFSRVQDEDNLKEILKEISEFRLYGMIIHLFTVSLRELLFNERWLIIL